MQPELPPDQTPDSGIDSSLTCPGSTAQVPPGRLDRYHLLPIARVAANMDIVCVHTTGSYLFQGMGLPLFLMLSFVLVARRREPKPFFVNLKDRTRRLIWPWLFWGSLHVLLVTVEYYREDHSAAWLEKWMPMLFYGLWFLVFIYLADLIASPVLHALRNVPDRVFVPAAVLLGWVWVYRVVGAEPVSHVILGYMASGTTGVFFGCAIGRMLGTPPKNRWRWVLGSLFCVGLWYFCRDHIWTGNMRAVGWAEHILGADDPRKKMNELHWLMTRYHLAMLVLLACFQWQGVRSKALEYWGSLTIGIYILHYGVKRYNDLSMYLLAEYLPVEPGFYHSPTVRFWVAWVTTALIVAGFKRLPGFKRFL